MEFTFVTDYNQKAMTTMARVLRKTIRKKRNLRSHIFGWVVIVLGVFLTWDGLNLDFRRIVTWLAILLIAAVLIWEDKLNGYIALKRILPGTNRAISVFNEDAFSSTTEVGKTEWNYEKIVALAETKEYFVFIFSASHAQVYDKRSLSGGKANDFREFIEDKTRKRVLQIP